MGENEVLAVSLAECVLAEAILIHPRPPVPPQKVRGLTRMYGNKSQKNYLLVNGKKVMLGWLNVSLKSTETKDELSTTCNPKVMSRCLSTPDATSLHHCLKNN